TNVYPGPQDDQVTRGFAVDDNGNQSLAEMGFVVINASSRGSSPLRGRDFYTYGYGNLRDYPLADDKHTIEELAKSHSFIDLNRVGIYGHSGGAFQTAAAMMTYPDFYKVGVAASGNHDNNIYIQWWGEVFHGLDEVTDSVTGRTKFRTSIPTNMELAPNLKGRLLLITGDVDKNVPPSCTYRLADALIRAGKRFDMFVLPGKDHGVQCSYYQNMIRYYFADNLLDPTVSHINIINHK
ncbi:prolyl oligopeptidase family serine peptidase, partial [uncultured Duncaniella sp.]